MGDQCETGILDFRFKLALTNLMWSSTVIFKPIKIYSKVIHLYLQKKKLLPIPTHFPMEKLPVKLMVIN